MRVAIGTSGYGYPAWRGRFYPAKLPANAMLGYYAERFGTVELNHTFYKLPPAATLVAQGEATPAHFAFAVKAPQGLTHRARLRLTEPSRAQLQEFLAVAGALGARRGPLLFQLPPNMKKDAPRLRDFLAALPAGCAPAFEFRHASWFDDETYAALRDARAALVIAEAEELATPAVDTAGWGYVRLRRERYTARQLAAWATRLQAQPWSHAFVYFKHEDTGVGPRYGARLAALVAGARPP